jgi:flagellar basal-body rod modification protein FlgD
MTVDATAAAASATGLYATATSNTTAAKQSLDGKAFLQLLVTQLTNQDPSSPMDTNQMMTQTTQLATMEQLTSIAANSRDSFTLQMRTSAAALVGREVSYVNGAGAASSGLVTSVSFAAAVPTVTIGKDVVGLDSVSSVTTPTSTSTSTSTSASA